MQAVVQLSWQAVLGRSVVHGFVGICLMYLEVAVQTGSKRGLEAGVMSLWQLRATSFFTVRKCGWSQPLLSEMGCRMGAACC